MANPKCPCTWDKKTRQYRDCKGKSCKPVSGQKRLDQLEKSGDNIKKFLKGLVGMEKGGVVRTIKAKTLRKNYKKK